jgi:prephenate dehydratase
MDYLLNKKSMHKIKFGFQGLTGAYHEKAAKLFIERNKDLFNTGKKDLHVEFVSCDVFETIFEKVEK